MGNEALWVLQWNEHIPSRNKLNKNTFIEISWETDESLICDVPKPNTLDTAYISYGETEKRVTTGRRAQHEDVTGLMGDPWWNDGD